MGQSQRPFLGTLYLGQTELLQWKRELTTKLSVYINSQQHLRQQWGSLFAGATLLADAAEADAVEAIAITTAACSNNTTGRATTTPTSVPAANHRTVASTETATLVVIMGAVGAMVLALALFVVLPGTKPSNALRRVNNASMLSP